jgi:hypothetical protein
MATTAARELVDRLCWKIPLLVLHDYDASGVIIKDTLQSDTRRYRFRGAPQIIDLGLRYGDIDGLPSEPSYSTISAERLAQAGLSQAEIDFLSSQRVELNAMSARQLVDFVEDKLKQHGISKVIPAAKTLKSAYEMFAASDRLSEAFEELKEKLEDESVEPIKVPEDLEARVKNKLQENSDITWHRAVRLLVDPDAPEDEDDDEDDGEHEDDEDLSDIDE